MIKFRKPRTEGKRFSARGGLTTALIGSDLIFFGGHCYHGDGRFEYHNDTMVLDLSSNTWNKVKTGGKSPCPRYGHSCSVIGTRVYIFGGKGACGKPLNDLFFLETSSWCWVEASSTTTGPCGRFGHASTVVGNKIVIHGGWDGNSACFDDLFIFDTAASTWIIPRTSGRPPISRHGHCIEITLDGRILLFGGYTMNHSGHPEYLNDVRCLDINSMVWTKPRVTGVLIDPRYSMRSCILGKYMICIGGFIKGKKSPSIVALDTETFEWIIPELTGTVPEEVYGHSISLAGNQFIIYGGWGGNRALDELFVGEAVKGFPEPQYDDDFVDQANQ